MSGTIVHFDIPAAKTERALGFYRKCFGWKFGQFDGEDDYHLTYAGGPPGGLAPSGAIYGLSAHDASPGVIVLYVEVDDIHEAAERVRENGGTVKDPEEIPGTIWYAHCTDSEGNVFGLLQRNPDYRPPE
jgi:predicted enzyme related to lactoylglutathione lyase